MGLLDKVFGAKPTKKATDDVLLLHSMLLMCGVDGAVEASEIATIEAFVNTLPEFEGKDFDGLMAQAKKLASRYPNLKDSVNALSEIQSEAIRRKAFVLAVDIAMSSGDVDESEEELLEAMQPILQIDDELAHKIVEVLALKYAR